MVSYSSWGLRPTFSQTCHFIANYCLTNWICFSWLFLSMRTLTQGSPSPVSHWCKLHISAISTKFIDFPSISSNFPMFSLNLRFLLNLRSFASPILTMMHLRILFYTYWTPLRLPKYFLTLFDPNIPIARLFVIITCIFLVAYLPIGTGVDLWKIFAGQKNYWGGQKAVKKW